ncbi:hypothetical protein IJG91_02285 [Candidatus Saccharibacteria bacterium]|nr:hypothetical protein [Candidatus Saccharibacteria bacterium]
MYDIRDSKLYTVRKLADGNCWMTQNLKYELSTGKTLVGADNATGEAISFTVSSCATHGNCPMNNNTKFGTGSRTSEYYYSWFAATAGSGSNSTPNYTDAPNSVCPAHWRMPPTNISSTPDKSYTKLVDSYITGAWDYEILESSPLDFARNGALWDGVLVNNDYSGYFWSSTADSRHSNGAYYTYQLYYRTDGANTYDSSSRPQGGSVRCVAL